MKKRDIFLAIFILVALYFTASDFRHVGENSSDVTPEASAQPAQP